MNVSKKFINNIVGITTINNQTAIVISSTYTSENDNYTSLGGAVGNVNSTEDLNKLLNEAANHAQKNMHFQTPSFSALKQAEATLKPHVCSIHQPSQNIPSEPASKPSIQKQPYTKPHSTTLTASQKQQDLIEKLCNERGKDLHSILAPYNKQLSAITSAEANEIIQQMKK